jgi:hypothetical protein
VVLGILTEVTKSRGALDLFRKFVDEFVLERVNFFLQFLSELVSHCYGSITANRGINRRPLEIINLWSLR